MSTSNERPSAAERTDFMLGVFAADSAATFRWRTYVVAARVDAC